MSGQKIVFGAADAKPADDLAFQRWYADAAKRYGLDPNPDSSEQLYDYRSAFKAGAKPDASGHWPSQFKKPGHPNEVVGGFNTRTGERVQGTPQASETELVRLGWDPETAKQLSATAQNTVTFGAQDAVKGQPVAPLPSMFELPLRALQSLGQTVTTPANWPTVGGMIGGAVGGVGGTVGGMGVGGVPGAIGGAALGGAAGSAAEQLVNRAMGRPAPGSMTAAATDIGKDAAVQGAMEAAGGAITKGAGAVAQGVYRGYLKPALNAVDLPKAREIVATALREALPITKAGEERATALITQINKQVGGLLQGAKGTVDLHQIAEKVRAFAKTKYYKPGVDLEDYKAALNVADTIDNHPSLGLPAGAKPTRVDVNPVQANEIKAAVRPNSRAYGQQGSAPEAATRKVAGHELRTTLEVIEPSIGPMNNRERQIIDAAEAVTKAAGREENRNAFFGVPTMLSGMAGAGYGAYQQDPVSGLAIAMASRLALAPAVASRMAILAAKFAQVPGTAVADALRIAATVAMNELEAEQPRD